MPGDTLVMDFDEGATLVLDSVYPAGCWQVGAPTKPVFTAALSLPRALVTDTVNPYPQNSTCYAEYTLIAGDFAYTGRWIEFDHWLDIDPSTHAWVEVYHPWLSAWDRYGVEWDEWYQGDFVNTPQGPEFDGSTAGWEHVILESPCIGVMDGGNERWYDVEMHLRFVFTSTGNVDGHDGWMVDNVRATATLCTGGVEDNTRSSLSMNPNPASTHVTLELDGQGATEVEIFRADGTMVKRLQVPVNNTMRIDVSDLPAASYYVRTTGATTRNAPLVIVR